MLFMKRVMFWGKRLTFLSALIRGLHGLQGNSTGKHSSLTAEQNVRPLFLAALTVKRSQISYNNYHNEVNWTTFTLTLQTASQGNIVLI